MRSHGLTESRRKAIEAGFEDVLYPRRVGDVVYPMPRLAVPAPGVGVNGQLVARGTKLVEARSVSIGCPGGVAINLGYLRIAAHEPRKVGWRAGQPLEVLTQPGHDLEPALKAAPRLWLAPRPAARLGLDVHGEDHRQHALIRHVGSRQRCHHSAPSQRS